MESLYRKYRPLTFESVVGQQHIVSTLEHAVAEGRLSHAYLFCGPRGTGKTTMARILAKSLLCEKAEAARAAGATGCNPDGTCPECEAIAAGTHPDVYELDAASRTGVDNVREEIINSVSFAPVRGAYKVYIIDEVHMLTTAAFNALLKTLEEPPAHVVFVLCTTDPQKLLETILSRCQRFDFHRIANEDLVARMRYICGEEGFAFDEEALEIVAKHARGGMRDALSTLEQLSVFGDGAVRVADARALLGEVASTVLAEFSCKIAVRDTPGLFGLVRAQVEEGNDLLELTRDLVGHMRDVYTAAIAGPRPELFDGTPEEVSTYVEEAKLFEGADRLARTLMVLDDAALEMRNASDARLVLEIALTRLARPEADLTLEALAERIARLEVQLAAGVPSGPARAEELVGTGTGAVAGARQAAAGAGAGAGAGTTPAATAGRTVAAAGTAATPRKAGALPWETSAAGPAAAAGAAGSAAHAPAAAHTPAASAAGPAAPGVPASKPAVAPAADRAPVASAPTASAAQTPAAPAPEHAPAAPAPQPSAPVATRRAEVRAVEASAAAEEGTASETAAQAASGAADRAPAAPIAPVPAAPAPAASVPAASASASVPAAPARPTRAQQDEGVAAVMEPAAACAATPAVDDAGELQRKWTDVVKRVVAAQPSRGALLQSSRAQRDDGETLVVGFPKGSNFAIKMIGRPDSQAVVQPIVCEVFGKRVVSYVMDGGSQPPAAPAEAPSGSGEPGASSSGAAAAAPAAAAGPVPAAVSSPAGAAPTASASVAAASSATSSAEAPAAVLARAPTAGVPAPATTPAAAGPASATSAAQSAVDRDSAASAAASGPASEAAGPAVAPAAADRVDASTPAAPGPAVDHTSGPTVLPERDVEADRRAWEDQVPYDDAMIAAYAGDDEELPPFDTGAAPSSAAPAAASSSAPSSPATPEASPVPAAAAPTSSASRATAKPWERAVNPANAPIASAAPASTPTAAAPAPAESAPASASGSGSSASPAADPAHPFSHEAEGTDAPQTVEEAKAMLGNIFGAGVVFKDVEE